MAFLIDACLKGTLLLILIAGLAVALRRTSAASRHSVWVFGLAGLLVLPVVSSVLPWSLAVLPPATTVATRIPDASPSPAPFAVMPPTTTPATTAAAPTDLAPISDPAPASAPFNWAGALLITWVVGAALALIRLGLGLLVVFRIVRRTDAVTDVEWQAALAAAARQIGVAGPVPLRFSSRAPLPMTAGVLRPVIVLPLSAAGWTDARRRAVLLHELAHIRRRDLLAQLVAQLACVAYWFHPLAWVAAGRLRAEGERACDDLVLISGARPSEYAGHLLQLVRIAGLVRAPALALPMAQRSDFEGRLLAILEPGVPRQPPTRRAATLAAVAVVTLLLPIAALRAAEAQNPEPRPRPRPMVQTRQSPRTRVLTQTQPKIATNLQQAVTDAVLSNTLTATVASRTLVDAMRPELAGQARGTASRAVIDALMEAMKDGVVDVRRSAVQSLGQLEDTASVNALIEALRHDTDAEVRKTAAWSLGQLEDKRAVPALVAALAHDTNVEVRRTAAWALGQIEDATAVDGLTVAVRDADSDVRKQSVWALGQIENATAVPALIIALKDAEAEVRQQAAWALGQIESDDAVDALALAVSDQNSSVREQAVWALGQIQSVKAVPGLTVALRDSSADVRKQAAWALGQIENADAVTPLMGALADRNADVRQQAAWALGQIQSPRSATALANLLTDADADVRQQAAWALGQIDGLRQAPPGLIAALKDPNADVRVNAAHALAQIEDPAAVPDLILLLKDNSVDVRRVAIQALAQMDDPRALDALVAALKDSDADVRRAAAQALGRH